MPTAKKPKDNPRFVITNLKQSPQWIYEEVYCQRGEIENRIKELHELQIDRTSCSDFWANQFRVLLTAAAYVLMQELRLRAAAHRLCAGSGLLRSRRDGKPHQGTAQPVRRRMSTATLRANQLRLYLSSLAYVLVHALRRLALAGTAWARAQVNTIRLRLLKIAAEVRLSARRICLRYPRAYPWKELFAAAWSALRC